MLMLQTKEEAMSNKTNLSVGERVKVVIRQGRDWEMCGDTTYEITEMNFEPTGYRCMIREVNDINPAVKYKPHEFDVSLLRRA
jgi:hypothetical protein